MAVPSTQNPYLKHAKRHNYRSGPYAAVVGPKKPPRTVYRRYAPMVERVSWHIVAWDTSSVHASIRMFGFLRRERLWALLETTGAALDELIVSHRADRRGLTITWKTSPLMRDHVKKLARSTLNTITRNFVDDCLAVMDRINRVRHKHIPNDGGAVI